MVPSALPPNGLELSCPADASNRPPILAHDDGPGTLPYDLARRVSFSELLGGCARRGDWDWQRPFRRAGADGRLRLYSSDAMRQGPVQP